MLQFALKNKLHDHQIIILPSNNRDKSFYNFKIFKNSLSFLSCKLFLLRA